jgi:hypothetical protein
MFECNTSDAPFHIQLQGSPSCSFLYSAVHLSSRRGLLWLLLPGSLEGRARPSLRWAWAGRACCNLRARGGSRGRYRAGCCSGHNLLRLCPGLCRQPGLLWQFLARPPCPENVALGLDIKWNRLVEARSAHLDRNHKKNIVPDTLALFPLTLLPDTVPNCIGRSRRHIGIDLNQKVSF